jgi:hypothetical protein
MRRIMVRHPSPATVVAFLALLVALGGTSYAVVRLPANSVGAKELKVNAVTAKKIKRNAVTGAKIKRNAVTGAKVKADSLSGLDIKEPTLGKVPSAGTADRATTADTAGVANSLARGDVNQTTAPNPDNAVTSVSATCDAGLKAVSAGVQVQNPDSQFVIDMFPTTVDTWTARVANAGIGGNATLFVICGAINSVTF